MMFPYNNIWWFPFRKNCSLAVLAALFPSAPDGIMVGYVVRRSICFHYSKERYKLWADSKNLYCSY